MSGSGDRSEIESAAEDGQIVLVRPRVVENVGHVLGNLFQRMYHLIGQVGEVDGPTGAQLEASTRQLENFLQLALDYFSPLNLALQYVSGTEVAQSLARQLSEAVGRPVRVDLKLLAEGRLLVDPGRLARALGLLAAQLRVVPKSEDSIEVKGLARPPGRSLLLQVIVPRGFTMAPSSQLEMCWAVAEKFLELHGGGLAQKSTAAGELLWEIVLPLQS